MSLREQFEKETGYQAIFEDIYGNQLPSIDYVEWLESKVNKS